MPKCSVPSPKVQKIPENSQIFSHFSAEKAQDGAEKDGGVAERKF